jgi:hypothetical protein
MLLKYLPAELIDFALKDNLEACSLEAKVEPADARKEGCNLKWHGSPPTHLLDVCSYYVLFLRRSTRVGIRARVFVSVDESGQRRVNEVLSVRKVSQ